MNSINDFLNDITLSYYSYLNDDNAKRQFRKSPKDFIKRYLKMGDKVPEELNSVFEENENKFYHTAAIYLLGIIFYEKCLKIYHSINKSIYSSVDIYQDKHSEFLYNWFLISFFHDYGFSTAIKKVLDEKIFKTKDKNEVREATFKVIDRIIEKSKNNAKIRNPVVPSFFLDICHNYDRYIQEEYRKSDEFIDHGMLSGAYFYHNREEMYSKIANRGWSVRKIECEREVYKDELTGLIWSRDILDNEQLDAALIIIVHNIFFSDYVKKDSYPYEKNGLKDLIIKKPIFLENDYPLYFLLTFVDTIDIFKFIKKSDSTLSEDEAFKKFLHKVSIGLVKDFIEIEFKDELLPLRFKYFEYLKEQEYWLPIKLSEKESKIVIEIY